MAIHPSQLALMTTQLLQHGPLYARSQQPRDPAERVQYIEHLRRQIQQQGGAVADQLRLALFCIGQGDSQDFIAAIRSRDPQRVGPAWQIFDALRSDDLLPGSHGLRVDPQTLGEAIGPLLRQRADDLAPILDRLFPALKQPLAEHRADPFGERAARIHAVYRRHQCNEGGIELLRQQLADRQAYGQQRRARAQLSTELAEWTRVAGPDGQQALAAVIELLQGVLAQADPDAELADDQPAALSARNLLMALGRAGTAEAATLLRMLLGRLRELSLRLRAARELLRCQGQAPAELPVLLAQALQPDQRAGLERLLEEYFDDGVVPLSLVLQAETDSADGWWLSRLGRWRGSPAELEQIRPVLIASFQALLEQGPEDRRWAKLLSALEHWSHGKPVEPELARCALLALERLDGDVDGQVVSLRGRIGQLAARHGATGEQVLETLEPWDAMWLHWQNTGLSLIEALDSLAAAGAIEALPGEQRDRARAESDRIGRALGYLRNGAPPDAPDRDELLEVAGHGLCFAFSTQAGRRWLDLCLDNELIEEPHDEVLQQLAAIADPPLPISAVRQGGQALAMPLPAQPMQLHRHDFGTDRLLQPLLQAGIPLYDETVSLQWVEYQIEGRRRRFLIRPDGRLDIDNLLRELNRLLQYLGRPQRYQRLAMTPYSEDKYVQILCADPQRLAPVAERLRLPLDEIQGPEAPAQWLLLDPLRDIGEPRPDRRQPRTEAWAPPWSQLS